MEEGGKFIGHRIIPINALHSGKESGVFTACRESETKTSILAGGGNGIQAGSLRSQRPPSCYQLI